MRLHPYTVDLIAADRRRTLMHEIARERLIDEASRGAAAQPRTAVHGRLLTWVAGALVALGRLRRRVGRGAVEPA